MGSHNPGALTTGAINATTAWARTKQHNARPKALQTLTCRVNLHLRHNQRVPIGGHLPPRAKLSDRKDPVLRQACHRIRDTEPTIRTSVRPLALRVSAWCQGVDLRCRGRGSRHTRHLSPSWQTDPYPNHPGDISMRMEQPTSCPNAGLAAPVPYCCSVARRGRETLPAGCRQSAGLSSSWTWLALLNDVLDPDNYRNILREVQEGVFDCVGISPPSETLPRSGGSCSGAKPLRDLERPDGLGRKNLSKAEYEQLLKSNQIFELSAEAVKYQLRKHRAFWLESSDDRNKADFWKTTWGTSVEKHALVEKAAFDQCMFGEEVPKPTDRALRARPVPAQRDQVHAPEPHLAQCWRQPVPGQARMDKPTKGIGSQPVPHPGQGGPRDRPAEAEGATGCPHRGPPLRGPPRWCLEPLRAPPVKSTLPLLAWTGHGWRVAGKWHILSFQKAKSRPEAWSSRSPFRAGQHAAPSLTECPNNRWHGQGSPPSGPGCLGASKVRNLDKNLWVHGTVRHWRSTIPWVTAAQRPHRPGVKSLRHCRQYSGVSGSEEVNALAKLT